MHTQKKGDDVLNIAAFFFIPTDKRLRGLKPLRRLSSHGGYCFHIKKVWSVSME